MRPAAEMQAIEEMKAGNIEDISEADFCGMLRHVLIHETDGMWVSDPEREEKHKGIVHLARPWSGFASGNYRPIRQEAA